jgi:PQQ-like domain
VQPHRLWPPRRQGAAARPLLTQRIAWTERSAALSVVLTLLLVVAIAGRADAAGRRIWVARYDGPSSRRDVATAIAVSADGANVYVTGTSQGPSGSPPTQTTIAYSRGGRILWTAKRAGTRARPSIAVSPDGTRVFVASGTTMTAYAAGAGITRWSVNGTPGALVAVSPDGSLVFAAGMIDDCLAVRAYDTANGGALWTGSHCFSAVSYATAVAVSPDGSRVYLTGEDNSDSGGAYYTGTAAFETTAGNLAWFRGYGKCCSSAGNAIAASPDGSRVFVSAWDSTSWGRLAYRASDGKTLWQHTGGAGGIGIVVGPGGKRIFIGDRRYGVAAYDASTGTRVWHSRHEDPRRRDDSSTVGIAPNGRQVYVTGESKGGGTGFDFATVAYGGRGGSERWVERYNGPGNGDDGANGLSVSTDGRALYVVGASTGNGTALDYATVRYSTR